MIRKLLEYSDKMSDHIISFQHHYKISSSAEAIRTLILKGFEAYGNPLDDDPKSLVGKPGHKTDYAGIEAEKQLRYETLMRQLGLNGNEEN